MMLQIRYAVVKAAVVLLLLSFNPLASWSQTPAGAGTNSANPSQTTNWKTTKRGKHMTVRVNPGVNLSQYSSVAVGSVAYTGPSNKLKPQESVKLVSLLHDSLVTDLSTTKLSPETAAARTLILNADITKVKRSHPLVNVVTIAAVFVPLDLGDANVTARLVDEETSQVVAEIETVGCGQIYQVFASLQALGQSKIVLKKESRSIAREVARMRHDQQPTDATAAAVSLNE